MNVFSRYCLTFSANDCVFSLNEEQKVYESIVHLFAAVHKSSQTRGKTNHRSLKTENRVQLAGKGEMLKFSVHLFFAVQKGSQTRGKTNHNHQ